MDPEPTFGSPPDDDGDNGDNGGGSDDGLTIPPSIIIGVISVLVFILLAEVGILIATSIAAQRLGSKNN